MPTTTNVTSHAAKRSATVVSRSQSRRSEVPSSTATRGDGMSRAPLNTPHMINSVVRAIVILVLCAVARDSVAQPAMPKEPWKGQIGESMVRVIPRPFNKGREFEWSIGVARGGSQEVVLDIPDMMGAFVGAYVWTDRRLTLLAGETAAIVDIPSASVVDVLLVTRPQLSPDNRFLACLQIIPRYLDDGSAIYKIYDVSLTRAANRHRPELEDFDSLMNGGLVVFPAFERRAGRTRRLPDSDFHSIRSPLTWVTNTTVMFLDYSKRHHARSGRLSLVAVDVRRSHKDPVVFEHVIDAKSLVSKTAQSGVNGLQASDIQMLTPLPNGYRLRIHLIRNSGANVDFLDVDLR